MRTGKIKDRVLLASLCLFNEERLANVAMNRIAAEAAMSPGNLHYHFRRKEQIVERLLSRLEEQVEPLLKGPHASLGAVDDLWLFLHLGFESMLEYQFVYRDVDYLMTAHPRLAPRLRNMTRRAVETVKRLCAQLVSSGTMRASDADIDALAIQMTMAATCWFTFQRLLTNGDIARPGRAAYQVLSLLAPYLNDDARQYVDYLRRKYVT